MVSLVMLMIIRCMKTEENVSQNALQSQPEELDNEEIATIAATNPVQRQLRERRRPRHLDDYVLMMWTSWWGVV